MISKMIVLQELPTLQYFIDLMLRSNAKAKTFKFIKVRKIQNHVKTESSHFQISPDEEEKGYQAKKILDEIGEQYLSQSTSMHLKNRSNMWEQEQLSKWENQQNEDESDPPSPTFKNNNNTFYSPQKPSLISSNSLQFTKPKTDNFFHSSKKKFIPKRGAKRGTTVTEPPKDLSISSAVPSKLVTLPAKSKCIKQIEVMVKDAKESVKREQMFRSMVVAPQGKNLTLEGAVPSQRVHELHWSIKNKYDLLFRTYRLKKWSVDSPSPKHSLPIEIKSICITGLRRP